MKEALKYYGDIKENKHQQWAHVPGVYTGTCMVHKHEISQNVVIDGRQPLVFDIC